MLAPARWFLLEQGVQIGPFELDEVRERVLTGEIGPETWVWADGMPEWRPAREVPALVPPPELRPAHWHADDV